MGMMAQRAVALLVFFSSFAWVAAGNSQIIPAHRNSLIKVSSCNKNSPGYYVDEDNPCQVVNYCLADGTVVRLQCPPGTSVNQIYASCDAETEVSECQRRIRRRRQAPQTFNSQFVTLLAAGPPSSSSTFRQRSPQLIPQQFIGEPFMIIAREPQPSSPRRTITPRPRPQQLDNRATSATNTLTRPTSGSQNRGRRLMDTQFVSFDDHLIRQAINNNDNQANQASSFGAPNRLRTDTNSRSPPPRRPSQQQQPSQEPNENRNQNQNVNQHQRQDPFFPPPFFDTNPNFPPRPFFANLPRPQFPVNSPNQFPTNTRAQGNNFIPSPNDNAIVHDVRFPGPPRGQATSSQGAEEARRPSFRPSRPRPSDQSFRQQQQQQQQQQDEEEQDRQQQLHLQQQEEERIFRRPFQSPVSQNDQFRQLPPPIHLQPPQQDFFQEQFPVVPNPFPPRRPFRPTQTEAPPTTTTTTPAPVSLAPQEEILTQNRFRFGSLRPTIDTQRPQTQTSSLPPTQSQLQVQRRPSQQFQPQPQPQQFSPEDQQQFNFEQPQPQQFQPEPQQFNTAPQPQQFQTERPQPQRFETEPPQQFPTEPLQPQQFQTEQPQPQQFQTEQPPSHKFQTEIPRQFAPRRPLKFQQDTEQQEPETQTFPPEQSPTTPVVANRGRGRFRPSFQDGFDLPTTTPSTTPFQTSSPENTGLAPVTDDFGFKLDSTPFVQPTPPSFPTTFSDDIRPRRPSTDITAGFSDFSDVPATTEGLLASELDFDGNGETTPQIFDVTTQVPSTFGVESPDLETKEEPATTQELTTVTPALLDTTSTLRPTRIRRPLGPRPRPRVRTTTTTVAPASGDQQEETTASNSPSGGPRRRIRPFARRRRPFQSRNTTTESTGISVEEVTTASAAAGGVKVRPARRRRPLSALMAARRRKPIVGDSDTAASNLHATSPVTEEETLATVTEEQSDIEVTEALPVQETDQTDEVSTATVATEAIETETTTQDGTESKDKSRLRNLFSRRFVLKKQLARPVASR